MWIKGASDEPSGKRVCMSRYWGGGQVAALENTTVITNAHPATSAVDGNLMQAREMRKGERTDVAKVILRCDENLTAIATMLTTLTTTVNELKATAAEADKRLVDTQKAEAENAKSISFIVESITKAQKTSKEHTDEVTSRMGTHLEGVLDDRLRRIEESSKRVAARGSKQNLRSLLRAIEKQMTDEDAELKAESSSSSDTQLFAPEEPSEKSNVAQTQLGGVAMPGSNLRRGRH